MATLHCEMFEALIRWMHAAMRAISSSGVVADWGQPRLRAKDAPLCGMLCPGPLEPPIGEHDSTPSSSEDTSLPLCTPQIENQSS